jgi:SOS-response transcriptional repressor LexA
VVDLFNEGVDIPLVDRVVMLRPTESKIVFLQQLGRGLRSAVGKTRLDVIDFVGNHRVFASRLLHLLSLVPRGAAEDTGFAVLRTYLGGGEAVLPPGCVVDVDLEAKDLLARFLPTGRQAVKEAYRSLRAELGRRPTPSELVRAGYLPRTLSAEYGSWFGFVQAEGDLDPAEQEVFARFEPWLSMLQTTSLTKSYKMVVLRVLLDRDSLWTGMEIGELAAACRAFLENHPALRADLEGAAFRRVPGDAVTEQKNFTAWWLGMPLAKWLAKQAGKRWFQRKGNRFVAALACPPDLREAFETLSGEMVDYRLAEYRKLRLRAPAGSAAAGEPVSFHAKVIPSRGKPFLKLPTVEEAPGRPAGLVLVRLPDGREWEFRFVKIACNLAGPREARVGDKLPNELPTLLRKWFGPDAGVPGTRFEVRFHREGDVWHVAPVGRDDAARRELRVGPAGSAREDGGNRSGETRGTRGFPGVLMPSPPRSARYVTHVPVHDLAAAAGFWGPESVPKEIGWTEVPGVAVKPGMFVAQVVGRSMEPLIPDGSWCLFRPCPAGSREGRIVLVQFAALGAGENGGRFTVKKYHSEKTVTADGWRHDRIQLLPLNPAFGPITLEPEDVDALWVIGTLQAVIATEPSIADPLR